MAPSTNGMSLFNLGNMKGPKDVDGNMVIRSDARVETAAAPDGKVKQGGDISAAKSATESAVKPVQVSAVKPPEATSVKPPKSAAAAPPPPPPPPPATAAVKAASAAPAAPAAPAAAPAVTKTVQVPLNLAAEAAAAAAAKSAGSGTALANSKVIDTPGAPATPVKPAVVAVPATPPPAPATTVAPTSASVASAAATKPQATKPQPQLATELETAASKLRAEDARAAWQPRPRVPVRLLDSYVNFMVVGESGLGKTTFIRNLVSSYTTNNKPHDGSSTSLANFQCDPDSLRTVLEPMEVLEAGRRVHVTVQDMPGWADDINLVYYLRTMVKFVLEQRAKDYENLAGGRALPSAAMCGQLQHSITACVYFLTPHRFKKVDLIMISALSQLLTVIPVIAKADTMTDSELAEYRSEIRTRLASPSKFVHSKNLAPLAFSNFTFDESVLEALGVSLDAWPLAIITSNKQEPIADRALLAQLGLSQTEVEQPVRSYKWGAAYALNREHSDLIVLKRLLLGDRVESLYAMLDESYAKYVTFCEQYEESGKQLPLMVQDELSAAAHLEYDDYSNARSALDAAQQAMSTLLAENKLLAERLQALENSSSKERTSGGGAKRF